MLPRRGDAVDAYVARQIVQRGRLAGRRYGCPVGMLPARGGDILFCHDKGSNSFLLGSRQASMAAVIA